MVSAPLRNCCGKEHQMQNKKSLLVISFGTSHENTRKLTIEAIENDLRNAFPDRAFYRAWTSGMIRSKLKKKGSLIVFSIQEAIEQMVKDGVNDVLVQFTHVLKGEEYDRSIEVLKEAQERFDRLYIGEPLVSNVEDVAKLAGLIEKEYPLQNREILAMMGHGSARMAFPAYEKLQEQFIKDGFPGIVLGTVEFEPGIAPVLSYVKESKPQKVTLAPLLVVAGDHALTDMAGEGPDSWKNRLLSEGPDVSCVLKGLGEYGTVRAMYVEHARAALENGDRK